MNANFAKINFRNAFLQAMQDCETDLHSLESVPKMDSELRESGSQNLDFNKIYTSALLLSAHLRYMTEDWERGTECAMRSLTIEIQTQLRG